MPYAHKPARVLQSGDGSDATPKFRLTRATGPEDGFAPARVLVEVLLSVEKLCDELGLYFVYVPRRGLALGYLFEENSEFRR